MLHQTATTVLIRVAQQHRIHIWTTLRIRPESGAQISANLSYLVPWLSNIDVNENRSSAFEDNEGHIPIANGENVTVAAIAPPSQSI